jgi:hypothetical protein
MSLLPVISHPSLLVGVINAVLGRTLLDELENLFRSYWGNRLGVSDGLLQVLGHRVRVKTREVQGHQLQDPEHHVGVPVYELFPYSNIEVI